MKVSNEKKKHLQKKTKLKKKIMSFSSLLLMTSKFWFLKSDEISSQNLRKSKKNTHTHSVCYTPVQLSFRKSKRIEKRNEALYERYWSLSNELAISSLHWVKKNWLKLIGGGERFLKIKTLSNYLNEIRKASIIPRNR